MSVMFEVLYKPPGDPLREERITASLRAFGGRLTFREETDQPDEGPICLTYEFNDAIAAQQAAIFLRQSGEHVEGPMDYSSPPPVLGE
ncbi:MAG: hypothetical protein ACRD36_13945 [Candidatus Acidiferrum sp.]